MSELAFLGTSAVSTTKSVLSAMSSGHNIYSAVSLTQTQVHKLVTSLKFVAGQPAGERAAILGDVGCPDSAAVAALVQSFEHILSEHQPLYDLRDFDWSTSVVLGTSTISNVKEPLCTLRFDVEHPVKPGVTSRNVELSLDEAEHLLTQLEAARRAQQDLLRK